MAPLLAVAWPQPAAAGPPVTATGRFVYIDDKGAVVGIKHARVEMCDEDFSLGCAFMGSATTDKDGNFTVVGTGEDPFGDRPDPRVRVVAESSGGRIGTPGWPHKTYCFGSPSFVPNATGATTLSFGTVSTATGTSCYSWAQRLVGGGSVAAAQQHRGGNGRPSVTVSIQSVDVRWPSPSSSYGNGLIGIAAGDEWKENIVWHEYGHFVMERYLESPNESFSNGICDTPQPAHCMWLPENGTIHFTEGWPTFFADMLSTRLGGRDLWSPREHSPTRTDNRHHPHLGIHGSDPLGLRRQRPGQPRFELVERSPEHRPRVPVVGAQHLRPGPSRPAPQPPNIDPGVLGWREGLVPNGANRLSAIFDENGIPGRPRAELTTSVTNPPASIVRGTSFVLNHAVHNSGPVDVGEDSTIRLFLSANPTYEVSDLALTDVNATEWNLLAGGSQQLATAVRVPSGAAPGQYHVVACVDMKGDIFEQDDLNNCSASAGKVQVSAAADRHLTVWRPSSGEWFTLDRQTGTSSVAQLGYPGDVPVVADYDGDAKQDRAIWRPSERTWRVIRSSTGAPWVPYWDQLGEWPCRLTTTVTAGLTWRCGVRPMASGACGSARRGTACLRLGRARRCAGASGLRR